MFAARYGLDRAANFEGRWHLHTFTDTAALQQATGLEAGAVRRLLLSARNKLLAERDKRIRPARDEKILCSWNALAIKGMAAAGRLLGRDDWIDSAERALHYLVQHHWVNGRLLATSRDGRARLNAYLDDHAYLIDALLELLQARWRSEWLAFALQLAQRLLEHFEDRDGGGFFFTSDDHETLVHRPKALGDDATPSGNAVALEALQALATLTGNMAWHDAAERTLRAAWSAVEQAPYAHVGLLEGLAHHLQPPELLVIRGDPPALTDWLHQANTRYAPARQVFAIPSLADELPDELAAKRAAPGHTLAYRCHGSHCEPPLDRRDLL